MNTHDFATLEAFRESSTPERWAALLALAKYMTAAPDLRLGQSVVNALDLKGPQPDLFYMPDREVLRRISREGFVIRWTDTGHFNENEGFMRRGVSQATRYPTREAAEAAQALLSGPTEVLDVKGLV